MNLPSRPRRSMLYMPASNVRALEKARGLPADGLIFDLEDAVAPDSKAAAREAAVSAVKSRAYGPREVLIRVNALDTAWSADDLKAAAGSGAHGIVLPKVNSADDVRNAATALANAGAPDSLLIWSMMETPRGILAAADIARVNETLKTPRLAGFLVGTADLAKDLRCAHPADRAPMLYALQHCIMAARAFGINVLDGVHVDLDDEAGFAEVCRQGRALGFDGKTLIHPKQIAVANAAYAPSPQDLERARRLIAAHKEASAQGKGVTVLDGKLVEVLHVVEAEHLLAQADAIAVFERQGA
ncbi:MAG: CoA ester lyase [Rhodospirillaceae bacterium]|nr:MAG: CoA ester lyase [Rhodospirillaceae bacterium]